MKRVIVIGGGLGGLSTAIRLARKGFRVNLLERNNTLGGKMARWEASGYRFDTGPTLLTMPFVLEDLLRVTGRRLDESLELVPLDPLCRYRFADGTSLDATSDTTLMQERITSLNQGDGKAYRRFLEHARQIYKASAEPFLFSEFGSLRFRDLVARLAMVPAILKLDALRSLDTAVRSYFKDPRLHQLFNRFATYTGSSPFHAPATLAVIAYIELVTGGWYVRGGMYRIAELLGSIARQEGVSIKLGEAVTRIVTRGGEAVAVQTAGGDEVPADAIVCNADALTAKKTLFGGLPPRDHARTGRLGLSTGGFVLLLGVRRRFHQLAHHNVFFSQDYAQEFDSIVDRGVPHEDPTVYVSVSSHTDPDHAPAECSNLFVLVNVPPLKEDGTWKADASAYRDVVVRTLGRHGLILDDHDIAVERVITPLEFADQYNAHRGSIYGPSSNTRRSAFFRIPNRARGVRNLFFVGGSSHPGGGVPMVLLSGKIVAEMVGGARA